TSCTGHCTVRENPAGRDERAAVAPTDVTFAEVVRAAGHRTACFGKWGFGPEAAGQPSHPNERGFDEFFGYITHIHAHDYYPSYLWDRVEYPENVGAKVTYAPELFMARSLEFIERNREQPFLLFFSPMLPHAPGDVPDYGQYASESWPNAMKAHAAQVTVLDDQVGRLVAKLTETGVVEDTLVVFVGDNGPYEEGGGYDPRFFDASGPLRGVKRNVYEGGIRVPAIAWSPGLVGGAMPEVAGRAWTVWDLYPTFADPGAGARAGGPRRHVAGRCADGRGGGGALGVRRAVLIPARPRQPGDRQRDRRRARAGRVRGRAGRRLEGAALRARRLSAAGDGHVPPRHPGDALTVQANLVPAPPSGDAYVSDMVWIRAENGFGPLELDRSNGTNAAGDGEPISLAGRRYEKGLGTHAESKLAYYVGGGFARFAADVGIDDFPSSGGSVQFYVFGDGEQLDTTGILTRATGPRWADARVLRV
ncbi:MAG: sulfatase-like hydrolase/transferase, partial [Solirubrobacteraceae bacterium]